jgi:hypothetical protein
MPLPAVARHTMMANPSDPHPFHPLIRHKSSVRNPLFLCTPLFASVFD